MCSATAASVGKIYQHGMAGTNIRLLTFYIITILDHLKLKIGELCIVVLPNGMEEIPKPVSAVEFTGSCPEAKY